MLPNVLLVIFDAARRDALEPYGAASGSTPAIAQLAARGRALPEVYATGCWTVPSHASIFTGLLPRAAGLSRVASPRSAQPILESHRSRMLPEVLRRAGYATGAVSANLWLSEQSGFDVGFDDFVSVDTGRHVGVDGARARRARMRWLAQAARAQVDDGAADAETTLAHWIGRPRTQPFFWFVNVIECHSPYLPPRPYGGVSPLDRVRAAEDTRLYLNLDATWRACVGGFDVPGETLARMRRLYSASIRYMDDWLSRLLERLDSARLLDDTLLIVASDHGENFGEGGFMAHTMSLDNRLIHVPFVTAGPGSETMQLNSLASLPRAIAEAIGEENHPWRDGPPEGVGVAQFDPPINDPDDKRVRDAVARWGLGEEAVKRFTTSLTCAVSGMTKLLLRGEELQVYDLASDPLELNPEPLEQVAGSKEQVTLLKHALDHPAVAVVRPEESPAASGGGPTPEELSDIEERMKLLGYM